MSVLAVVMGRSHLSEQMAIACADRSFSRRRLFTALHGTLYQACLNLAWEAELFGKTVGADQLAGVIGVLRLVSFGWTLTRTGMEVTSPGYGNPRVWIWMEDFFKADTAGQHVKNVYQSMAEANDLEAASARGTASNNGGRLVVTDEFIQLESFLVSPQSYKLSVLT